MQTLKQTTINEAATKQRNRMLRWAVQVSLPGGSLTNLFLQTNVLILNKQTKQNKQKCPRIHTCIILSICSLQICSYLLLSSVFFHFMLISLMKCWMHQWHMSLNAPCMYFCKKLKQFKDWESYEKVYTKMLESFILLLILGANQIWLNSGTLRLTVLTF